MNAKHALYTLILGAAIAAAGCDRQPDPKASSGKPNIPPPPPQSSYQSSIDKAIADGKAAGMKAAEEAKAKGLVAKDAVVDAVNDAKSSEAARNAEATASNVAADVKAQGSELIGKLESAIKENRLNEAQTYVDAFERIKANVPEELKTRFEALKTQLKSAKDRVTTPQPQPPAEPNK